MNDDKRKLLIWLSAIIAIAIGGVPVALFILIVMLFARHDNKKD